MERSQAALVAMLAAGGKGRAAAVTELFRKYSPAFKKYFRRHRLPVEVAEDLVQETFVKVVRSFDSYRADSPLEAWLWAIARNTLTSHFRSKVPEQSLDDLEPDHAEAILADTQPRGSDPAVQDCIRRALAEFSSKYRESSEALMRVVADGWGYDELSVFLNRNPGATREFVSQCRKRVREFLQPCFELAERA